MDAGGAGYREQTKAPVNPVRVHADREYTMSEAAAFVAAVKRYGDDMAGVIFYSKEKVTMFFDESNREEGITLPFQKSLELSAWLGNGAGTKMTQKQFLKTVETFPECLENPATLRALVERMQMSKEIKFESDLDPDKLTFVYAEKGGQQTASLPRRLVLSLPYFEGSKSEVLIDAELSVEMPKSSEERPVFVLMDQRFQRTERDAIRLEIEGLRSELPGWLFLNGEY